MNNLYNKKLRKFRLKGLKVHNKKLYFGFYGLKALETGRIDSNVFKSLIDIVKRKVKLHKGKFWFSLNQSIPVTQTPIGTRMGKGKGNISKHVAFVRKGQILLELSVPGRSIAFKILTIASSKLPVKSKIVVYWSPMPQLDIILWFSQTFWFLLFCIFFISFVFVLYIPISCYAEGLPFYKKKDHYYRYNDLFFSYSKNIQDFFFYHNSR